MNSTWTHIAASSASAMGLIAAGVVIVALLLGAFVLGARIRRREPRPPRPEEQPRVPDEGPVREVLESREPDEVPRSDTRLTPHELPGHGNSPSRSAPSKPRPRWREGGSGSFGSGGPGVG
ncbi:DUF6479 family protein [Streptomyces cylindrosporus]|uniref:DUF6479 family protein n=1 Tax=Streptomyces cylindrosporus TaxID=2927583 RepID=A0ABS9YNX7_9ACTN|nr:DUF6479 family protein [Streptomyces cylindrosporus]MCI3278260.1 DUF6479 family protein [Streptomyces cylindrosporus]